MLFSEHNHIPWLKHRMLYTARVTWNLLVAHRVVGGVGTSALAPAHIGIRRPGHGSGRKGKDTGHTEPRRLECLGSLEVTGTSKRSRSPSDGIQPRHAHVVGALGPTQKFRRNLARGVGAEIVTGIGHIGVPLTHHGPQETGC